MTARSSAQSRRQHVRRIPDAGEVTDITNQEQRRPGSQFGYGRAKGTKLSFPT